MSSSKSSAFSVKGAWPIFLLILNALCKGFQMRYHLFQNICEKVVELKETSFLLSKCLVSIGQHTVDQKVDRALGCESLITFK